MLMGEVTAMMPDQFLSAVATAVAGKAAELAVQGGKNACASLVKLIRERLGCDKDATAALETASGHSQDNAAVAALALALERLTAQDADFAARLRTMWPSVEAELSARDGGMVNSATGTVGGHLMQARDVSVEGGLHFGDVRPEARKHGS
jgi:hypothetical protein